MIKNKRILVTGGAGFVGHHLVQRLSDEPSNKIYIIDNLSFGRKKLIPNKKNVIFHKADIYSEETIKIISEIKPQVVYHLAAIHFVPYCNKHPEGTFIVNVMGTRNLLNVLLGIKPEFLFFASTAAVYSPAKGPHNEETSVIAPIDIYGSTKLIGEDLCYLFYKKTNVTTVIGRLFNIYGPGETNPHFIPSLMEQINKRVKIIKLGNLYPKRDYIHVKNIVDYLIKLYAEIDSGFHIFNIGTGKEYSVRETLKILNSIVKHKLTIIQATGLKRKVDRPHLLADIRKISQKVKKTDHIDFRQGLADLYKPKNK